MSRSLRISGTLSFMTAGALWLTHTAAGQCLPVEVARLSAFDGHTDDQFGYSVAISGDTVVVGARYDKTPNGNDSGSAYVFVRDTNGAWSLQAKLIASDGGLGDNFGHSVAIDGDTILVSANLAGPGRAGAVYAFSRTDGNWSQTAEFFPSTGIAYGWGMALQSGTAFLGRYSGGGVDIRSGANWTDAENLSPPNPQISAYFGASVALSGDVLVIGAPGETVDGLTRAGAAYVFTRNFGGNAWTEQARLVASDVTATASFGSSAATTGDSILVGAYNSLYEFSRNPDGAWIERSKLLADDSGRYVDFGVSIAMSSGVALIGADRADSETGRAYVYSRVPAGPWIQRSILTASDASATAQFGGDVAISGNIGVVGARFADTTRADNAGEVYIFELACTVCLGDTNNNNLLDLSDLGVVLACFATCSGDPNFDPIADFDQNGCIDLSDLGIILANFGATCEN